MSIRGLAECAISPPPPTLPLRGKVDHFPQFYVQPGEQRHVIQQAIVGVRASLFSTLSAVNRERVITAIVQSIDDVFITMITISMRDMLRAVPGAFIMKRRPFCLVRDCVLRREFHTV